MSVNPIPAFHNRIKKDRIMKIRTHINLPVEVDVDVDFAFDGIGAYECHGTRGFDRCSKIIEKTKINSIAVDFYGKRYPVTGESFDSIRDILLEDERFNKLVEHFSGV